MGNGPGISSNRKLTTKLQNVELIDVAVLVLNQNNVTKAPQSQGNSVFKGPVV